MPITFAIPSVLDRLRASVIATLTTAGEAPTELASRETAEQVAQAAGDLPVTILEIGSVDFNQDNCNVNSLRFCQKIIVHHIRSLQAGGSASDTATARLSAIAAALVYDYRLESVSVDSDPPIESVAIMGIERGEQNPVQAMLESSSQVAACVAVALRLEIHWVEDK